MAEHVSDPTGLAKSLTSYSLTVKVTGTSAGEVFSVCPEPITA